jgi:hypothetical protein
MKNVLVANRARSRSRRGVRPGVRADYAATHATPVELPKEASVDALLRQTSVLVAQRQELRKDLARVSELEKNRLQIVHCQLELNHALIALHGHRAA